VQRQKPGGKSGEVEHCCKHCQTVLSRTNVTRLKTHLLNGNTCKILQSAAAAELTKVVKEVKAALLVYMPKASSSKRCLTSLLHVPGENRLTK